MPDAWDRVVDVVVVGSGAAGLAAALAAGRDSAVEVLEKASLVGGTTAWSGGMPWIPRNHHMAAAGVVDSRSDVLTYIDGLVGGRCPDHDLIEVFVDRAAEALQYVESHSAARLRVATSFSDYYADRPGGLPMGRSLEPLPLDSSEVLGDWHRRVRDNPQMPNLTQDEMAAGGARRNVPLAAGRVPDDIAALIAQRNAAGTRTRGAALAAGLLRGVLDQGTAVRTDSAVQSLVVEHGEIAGVVTAESGATVRVGARLGVVLATGGFEWNRELVRAYLGVPRVLPLSPPTNVGDGLVMGQDQGAAVGNMTNAVSFPATWDGRATADGEPLGFMAGPRHDPGCIIVNRDGRRFVNEGVPYVDMAKVSRAYDVQSAGYPNEIWAWMVFDSDARDRTIVSDFRPGGPTPEWVQEASDIEQLGERMGVDLAALADQVRRWNGYVQAGADPEFGRGTVWYEAYQTGGPSPAKNMAEVARPPYFAMKVYDGVLGTVGGLRIDGDARVLHREGRAIPRLYAAGNVAAGIFGAAYPGGGSTLGPAITFGYLAGSHARTQAPHRAHVELAARP